MKKCSKCGQKFINRTHQRAGCQSCRKVYDSTNDLLMLPMLVDIITDDEKPGITISKSGDHRDSDTSLGTSKSECGSSGTDYNVPSSDGGFSGGCDGGSGF